MAQHRRRIILWLAILAFVWSASPRALAVPVKPGVRDKKGPVRILLLTSGPSREYQFVKTLFSRKAKKTRLEVGILLQSSQVEEIRVAGNKPPVWMLGRFPNLHAAAKPADKPYVLFDYDLVIAFDPDWRALPKDAGKLLKQWVGERGGNLVLIAGPVHTHWLAQKDLKAELTPVRDLYPVVLDTYRHKKKGGKHRIPAALNFNGDTRKLPFLNLDEKGTSAVAAWNEFFYGTREKPKEKPELLHGFYTTYPVKAVKTAATVVASTDAGEQKQPYLVTMPVGVGKVFYMGSGETWRLRLFREHFHERFWVQLVRYLVPTRNE
jgi:hypothetical protein